LDIATVSGGNTVLSVPDSGFHDGILQFTGPVTSLSLETNSTVISDQDLTFGLLPEPPSGPVAIIPTMGQWGMIIATILFGFFAIAALRKRRES